MGANENILHQLYDGHWFYIFNFSDSDDWIRLFAGKKVKTQAIQGIKQAPLTVNNKP
jgi:hypothetical protein